MFSKTEIEKSLSEDGTSERSLENANTIMFGGGYECDGIRVYRNANMSPQWVVFAHFTHINYRDVIEHRFTGFDLNVPRGARAMAKFYKMFNVHPHFNPFQPKNRYEWGHYSKYDRK